MSVIKSGVAAARAEVDKLRDAKARAEERLSQKEEELRSLLADLKARGLPVKISELEKLKEEKEAEARSLLESWQEKLASVKSQLADLKNEVAVS